MFAAFEYRSYEKRDYIPPAIEAGFVEEYFVPPTKDKPEIPKPAIVRNVILNLVADDFPEDDEPFIDASIDEDAATIPFVFNRDEIDEPVPEDIPFWKAEKKPEFPGGELAMFEYLSKNITYPELAKNVNIQGVVYVNFVIDKDGSVVDVTLERGIGGGCDEEALRIVANMPKWSPGMQREMKVRCKMTLPVKFRLVEY